MKIEVYVLIDSEGTFWVHTDPTELDSEGGIVHPTRLLQITLDVPTPAYVELSAVIPAEVIPSVPVTMTVK